jgi:hypothetical protein
VLEYFIQELFWDSAYLWLRLRKGTISLLRQTILTSVAHGWFDLGKPRDASNDMPNRCYLAWRLISLVAIVKLLSFRTSNLPASKEDGQGDCGRANQMDAYEQKVVSLKRLPFIHPCLVPARPG